LGIVGNQTKTPFALVAEGLELRHQIADAGLEGLRRHDDCDASVLVPFNGSRLFKIRQRHLADPCRYAGGVGERLGGRGAILVCPGGERGFESLQMPHAWAALGLKVLVDFEVRRVEQKNALCGAPVATRTTHLFVLTKRAKTLRSRADVEVYRKGRMLPVELLESALADKAQPLFLRGDHDVAVFQAFKEVEVAVRKAAGASSEGFGNDVIGVNVMRKAFHPENGPLTGGESAFYCRSTDRIQMPDEGLFCGTGTMTRSDGYYGTLLHERLHATGSEKRLNRNMGKRFGDAAYAAEELVAEIGSAFLCSELGITQDVRADHAQYLAHWLKLLKDDSRAIFTAAAKASQAVAYLRRLQPPE